MNIFNWLDTLATTGLAAFVNGVLIGTLLCFTVWSIVRLMGKWIPINATTRFGVWLTVFLVCIGLVGWQGWTQLAPGNSAPAAPPPPFAPVAEMPVPPMEAPAALEAPAPVFTPEALDEPVAPEALAEPLAPEATSPEPTSLEPIAAPESLPANSEPVTVLYNEAGTGWSVPFHVPRQIELGGIGPVWRVLLFTIWLTVAGMLLLRVVLGWYGVGRLKAASYAAPERVQALLRKTLLQIKQARNVEVAISDELATAVAVGYLRPRILLPASMLSNLSQTELQQVLLHEAAHLQRWDDWTMLMQRIASALLFFHPGILFLGKLMDRDREYACDDWVIALTRRPKTYASCLAKLVSQYARKQPPVFVPGFSSEKEALFDRIKSILDKKRSISFRVSRGAYAGLLLAMALVLLLMVRFVPVVALPAHHATLTTTFADDIAPLETDLATPAAIADDETVAVVPSAPSLDLAPVAAIPDGFDAEVNTSSATALQQDVVAEAADVALKTRTTSRESSALMPASVAPLRAPTDGPPQHLPVPQTPVSGREDSSLSTRSMAKILRAASRIPSSGDKAQVLLSAVQKMEFDAGIYAAFLDAVETIPSSGDKARVLIALLDYQTLDEAAALRFLRVAALIPSSGDKSRVLLKSLKGDSIPLASEAVQDGFLDTIGQLESPDAYRTVLKAFMSHRNSGN